MSGILGTSTAKSKIIGRSTKEAGLSRNEGLVVKYVNATTVDVDADFLTLFDASNFAHIASSVNLTAAITASGINGLDTGSEGTSTWYHIYVIYNGTTVASLLSENATSPTMPAGYTFKKYVGAVFNGSDGDFDAFHQLGNVVATAVFTTFNITTTSYASNDVVTAVPPTARGCAGYLQSSDDSGDDSIDIRIASASSGLGECQVFDNAIGARTIRGYFNVRLTEANTVYTKESHASDISLFVINQYFWDDIV